MLLFLVLTIVQDDDKCTMYCTNRYFTLIVTVVALIINIFCIIEPDTHDEACNKELFTSQEDSTIKEENKT